MAAASISFSFCSQPFLSNDGKNPVRRPSRVYLCTLRSSFSPSAPAKPPLENAPSLPPKKRPWKVSEFPDASKGPVEGLHRPRTVAVKKKTRVAANPWARTVVEAFSDRIRKKQWDQALEVFEMLRAQTFYYPKERTFRKLIILLGKSGQANHAGELFEIMVEEGIEPTSSLYTTLLTAYCRCNIIDKAFSILAKMKTLPLCQPEADTYCTLLKACVQSSNFELIASLYQDMSEHMISPDTMTQNIVLECYGKAGKFNEMEKVLTSMLESDACRPNASTISIVLRLFGSKGEIDMMGKWYETFCNAGIDLNTLACNFLISAYGRKRMYDKMAAIMEYMRKTALSWTSSTYNSIIESFAVDGDTVNMEYAFNQMLAEGMKPGTTTFCFLITGYANAGLLSKVASSINLAERFEIPHSTRFYNAVMYACSKAGDLMEMERVFKLMKVRNYKPDSATYSIMVETYRREGMNEKIYDLEANEGRSFSLEFVSL